MRTPRSGSPAVRLVGGRSLHAGLTPAGGGQSQGALARAAHHDEVRVRVSSGTYDSAAAAHALACVLLARGEV